MSFRIDVDALVDLESYFRGAPAQTATAARMALNQAIDRVALPESLEGIRDEVAFPDGYLEAGNRLAVSRKATDTSLEAVVSGRDRPTSLARFADSRQTGRGQGKLTVTVKPGHPIKLNRAWLIRLNSGKGITEDSFNIGLAVRLKPGQTIQNRVIDVEPIFPNVYLLYGPSVGQVFRSVAQDVSAHTIEYAASEFLRQFSRLMDL